MIPCENKSVLFATNLTAMVEHCDKLGLFVDDAICTGCSMRAGETAFVPDVKVSGRRSEEKIAQIVSVCNGCPLFMKDISRCRKILSPIPVSTLAQNPVLRCPENKW